MEKSKGFWDFVKFTASTRPDLLLVVPGLIVYVILIGVSINFQLPRVQRVSSTANSQLYPFKLTTLLDRVADEEMIAVAFLNVNNLSQTDRDAIRQYDVAVAATDKAVQSILQSFQADRRDEVDDATVSPFLLLDTATLAQIRLNTQSRSSSTFEVTSSYNKFQLSAIGAISAISAQALTDQVRASYAMLASSKLSWLNAREQDLYRQVLRGGQKSNLTILTEAAYQVRTQRLLYQYVLRPIAARSRQRCAWTTS